MSMEEDGLHQEPDCAVILVLNLQPPELCKINACLRQFVIAAQIKTLGIVCLKHFIDKASSIR